MSSLSVIQFTPLEHVVVIVVAVVFVFKYLLTTTAIDGGSVL